MNRLAIAAVIAVFSLTATNGWAATMYSLKSTFMGAGTFYGPGKVKDTPLFDAEIRGIGFVAPVHYITPFANNGSAEPNVCAERELGKTPTGMMSDGVTRINENINVCALVLNNTKVFAAIIDGGLHQGQQVAVTLDDDDGVTMIMTMDFGIDLGIGKAGIIKMPFYGTTAEVTLPYSLQTQMGIEGGVDEAGSLKSGDKIRGRLGDFNGDGRLDGAIVVAGNLSLDSIFMPGAPYALIRYFETDVPYDGVLTGLLPSRRYVKGEEPPVIRVSPPRPSPALGPHADTTAAQGVK